MERVHVAVRSAHSAPGSSKGAEPRHPKRSGSGAEGALELPHAPRSNGLGVYLHVPFCSAICHYCNFNRGLVDEALKARYVDALAREVESYADGSRVDTIYFGGGTPSLLSVAEFRHVLEACRRSFTIEPECEITIEMNPETAAPGYLEALRALGINRLSLGVQSFSDDELQRLGRIHSAERARAAVAAARAAGFDNVSLDLMMWLPGQSLADWLANVDALIGTAPEHASVYLLELYPNAPLRERVAREGWAIEPDDVAADMYEAGLERLEACGYRQYEISNVARDGRYAWHNVKYWTDGEWLGLGCGAHGSRGRARWRNLPGTTDYIDRVAEGRSARVETRTLSPDEALREALFMGLRLCGGVDVAALGSRYDTDVAERYAGALAPYVEAGLLVMNDVRWRLTRRGMLVANEVMSVFV